jgi:hypothetical protein
VKKNSFSEQSTNIFSLDFRYRILKKYQSGTLFLTKVPKICDGEKTASSTNVAGKSGYPSARN